jgi:hypothetical protein
MDEHGITFRWKDYRAKGRTRYKTMTLEAHEFMRRFLLHVLPAGFHRIRHHGLFANAGRIDGMNWPDSSANYQKPLAHCWSLLQGMANRRIKSGLCEQDATSTWSSR